jgi:hypothetical protein
LTSPNQKVRDLYSAFFAKNVFLIKTGESKTHVVILVEKKVTDGISLCILYKNLIAQCPEVPDWKQLKTFISGLTLLQFWE